MSANAKKYPLRFNSWTLGGHGADLFEKSAEALELERINPLRGVDEWRLGQIFDDARDGVYADLAWLYNEIEGVEPALVACCDMRESAASECGWLVNTADAARVRGFDKSLADEQRDALLKEFGAVADDVAELAGHLAGAFFRGAAHALPLWNADGSLAGFRHLDLWNFAFDRQSGIWYWNADASRDEGTFQPIPPGELVTLASTRHADHAALPIFIRAALGAKRYGVWLDRFGIPPVGVIMPPNAEKGEQGAYMDLARKFARGGSGILPNGSSVVYGTEARAVCPFIDFIRFQQQQIYLVGIGRVQSGETDGANLGGNAAGVVEDGFRRLVRRDARRIARAINDSVTRKVLARLFPGKPALAQFAWDTEAKRTAHEVLEDAGLAKSAGLAIDIDQLSELTGYKLEKAPETPQPGLFGGLNSDRTPHTPLQNAKTPLQNAPKKPDAQGEGQEPAALLGPFLRALQGDCKLIASEVEKLLENPTPEKARALLDKMPDLVPEDPALAPLIAEEMAKAYGEAFSQGAGAQPPVVVQNAGTSEGAKKGWETRRKNGWTPEQLAANKATVDSLIADLSRRGPNNSKAWKNEPKDLGEVSQALADEIHAANPDMKVKAGTMQTIDQDQLNHALEEHGVGKETRPNQIPITEEDLKRIPDVLADYDDIRRGLGKADGKQQEGVIFCKKYDDGTVCCVEIDWFRRKDNRRELKFQTMWKEKPEEGAKNE
ncbi:MAG: DUF935 family protein [Kiritimatiellae bacterium]|nr:DUF935 family protein [Kiritimatiellia bacterium]